MAEDILNNDSSVEKGSSEITETFGGKNSEKAQLFVSELQQHGAHPIVTTKDEGNIEVKFNIPQWTNVNGVVHLDGEVAMWEAKNGKIILSEKTYSFPDWEKGVLFIPSLEVTWVSWEPTTASYGDDTWVTDDTLKSYRNTRTVIPRQEVEMPASLKEKFTWQGTKDPLHIDVVEISAYNTASVLVDDNGHIQAMYSISLGCWRRPTEKIVNGHLRGDHRPFDEATNLAKKQGIVII